MKLYKNSFLMFTSLLWGSHVAWAMLPNEEFTLTKKDGKKPQLSTQIKNSEKEKLVPIHYVSQFTLPPTEASILLLPFWYHGNKGSLVKLIKQN